MAMTYEQMMQMMQMFAERDRARRAEFERMMTRVKI